MAALAGETKTTSTPFTEPKATSNDDLHCPVVQDTPLPKRCAYPALYQHQSNTRLRPHHVWYLTTPLVPSIHKQVGSVLAIFQGGVALYSIQFCIPNTDQNNLHVTRNIFSRARRWSSFQKLRKRLIQCQQNAIALELKALSLKYVYLDRLLSEYTRQVGELKATPLLAEVAFPPKTPTRRMSLSNNSINLRCRALGLWLQTMLGHANASVVAVVHEWLKAPDDQAGRTGTMTAEDVAERNHVLFQRMSLVDTASTAHTVATTGKGGRNRAMQGSAPAYSEGLLTTRNKSGK